MCFHRHSCWEYKFFEFDRGMVVASTFDQIVYGLQVGFYYYYPFGTDQLQSIKSVY